MVDSKRILILSNNCFSNTDSNGRTLANFFHNYPKEQLAQFYIQNAIPDFDVCNRYFRVTDAEALSAFKTGKEVGGCIVNRDMPINAKPKDSQTGTNKIERNALTCLLRDMVWESNRWKSNRFSQWIHDFSPEVLLLQVGDTPFMLKLATTIAKQRKIPLILYNSESYYFKEKNYMKKSGFAQLAYPVFLKKLKKRFEQAVSYAAYSIYSCHMLQETYDKQFHKPSTVIFTATNIKPCNKKESHSMPIFSYLGNMGVGRHEPLIEIATALQRINTAYHLNLYGKIPNPEIKAAFDCCKGIHYKGFIGYDEVITVMQNSDVLFHAENFSDFYKADLKYAFSTKIADSLSSGTCFFLYASQGFACTDYLQSNDCACVVTDKQQLEPMLRKIISEAKLRQHYIDNALKIVATNHYSEKNCMKFRELIVEVVKDWEKSHENTPS